MAKRPFLLWCIPASVVGFVVLWLRGIWLANANDKLIRDHFLFEAEKILHHPEHVPAIHPERISGTYKYFGFLLDWSAWFQLITAVFLAAICYFSAAASYD